MLTRRVLSMAIGCALFASPAALADDVVEVVWDAPVNPDLSAFLDQEFGDFPEFSIYLVHHVELTRTTAIEDITTYFTNLNNLWPQGDISAALNIYDQNGGLPDNADVPPQQGVTANLAAAANGQAAE